MMVGLPCLVTHQKIPISPWIDPDDNGSFCSSSVDSGPNQAFGMPRSSRRSRTTCRKLQHLHQNLHRKHGICSKTSRSRTSRFGTSSLCAFPSPKPLEGSAACGRFPSVEHSDGSDSGLHLYDLGYFAVYKNRGVLPVSISTSQHVYVRKMLKDTLILIVPGNACFPR